MPTNSPPRPSEFGLDDEVMNYFASMVRTLEMLPSLLGWLGFICLLPWIPFSFISKHEYAWPIILFYFLPGLLVGWGYNKFKEKYFVHTKKKHELYQNYEAYLKASSEWQRVNAKELEEERLRKTELRKRQAEEARRQINWWKSLDGKQFETELNVLLKQLGYNSTLTPYSGDGGVDIVIADGNNKIIVQCKAHRNYISPGVVRELYGTMIHEKASEGWIVTTSGFYSGARVFAHNKPIKLLTISDLLRRFAMSGCVPPATPEGKETV